MKMKSAQNDMTVGNPMKIILSFTFPIFLGNVFQQFYNMADAVIVGKFVGNKALAAVGSTGTIMFLIYGFVVGMTAGFTVLTAQKFGAGDMEGMRKTVVGAGVLSFVIGTILTILFMVFMKPLLILMNTPSDIFADAYAYIMIVSGGILAQMLYNLLSSILRALGNSKLPLYFLIISALLNIVLDLVFIIGFQMGAKGAAVATVIAQGTSGVLCLLYIIAKVPVLHIKRDDLQVGGTIYSNQLRIGIPMALQYSITAIGTMMVQSSLNILGSTLVAAYTAAGKIEQVVTQAYVAMGTTMATYGAQNMGAGKYDRADQILRCAMGIAVEFGVCVAVLIQFIAEPVVGLFTTDTMVVILGAQYIRGYIWDCIFAGVHFSFSGYFCAYGRSEISFIHNLIAILCVRIPGVYLTSKFFPDTLFPMGLATATGSLLSVIICVIFFGWLKRRERSRKKMTSV